MKYAPPLAFYDAMGASNATLAALQKAFSATLAAFESV